MENTHNIVRFGPRPRPHSLVSRNSHENFPVGHPSWDCSRVNSLNFVVLMEPKASELPKGLDPLPHENFPVGHPSCDFSHANSLNFEVPMEPEASELPKGLMLSRDGNKHIRLTGSTPLGDMGYYKFIRTL
ncbi:hypothetical protein DVH24_003669 [Malus domestica]|uniref:Uncharacterized protein n=1 Tax=Malus domestica TaxID=3750 RepID=A0A498INW6_MALDO|nr:hypothetical protein DVH24_003669 [Malus domestica]